MRTTNTISHLVTPHLATLSFALCLCLQTATHAEDSGPATFHFRSGGVISGTLVGESRQAGKNFLEVQTENGSVIKLRKSLIKRVEVFGNEQEMYRIALKRMPNTPSGHWTMCDWCKEHGGNSKFRNEIEYHLKEIVKLDPTDSKAWQKLDYTKVDGRWVPEEQHFRSLGYTKLNGKWISSVQLQSINANSSSESEFNARKKALKKWQNNTLGKKDFETVRSELFGIVDALSLRYFESRFLRKADDPRERELYLEAIGRVPTAEAQRILVQYAVEDSDREIREQAVLQLEQPHYPTERSTRYLASSYLKHPSNRLIRRAGTIIGRLKDESAIIPLIGSLETVHKEATGTDPNRLNTRFDSSGGVGFGTGGPKSVTVRRQNQSVLQALADITQQDFGFDSELWMDWYVAEHTVTNYDVGRDLDEDN